MQTDTTQVQRATQVILSGNLTLLQRRALADVVIALGSRSEPCTEHFKIIYSSVLDALAPTPRRDASPRPPLRFSRPPEPVSGPAKALVTLTGTAVLRARQRAMIAALLTVLSTLDLEEISPPLAVAFRETVKALREGSPDD